MYDKVADKAVIDRTITALKANGFEAEFAANVTDAKKRIHALIPKGSKVFNVASTTLIEMGMEDELNKNPDYVSVRNLFYSLASDPTKGAESRALGSAPDYVIGSVHALTEGGVALIASATGSQLPAYVFGAGKVIWVVGSQKIAKDLETAHKRLTDHVLPLESERAHKAYGVPGSSINKLLIINREVTPDRIHIIIVGEKLGF